MTLKMNGQFEIELEKIESQYMIVDLILNS
jgi:hypothetical protein